MKAISLLAVFCLGIVTTAQVLPASGGRAGGGWFPPTQTEKIAGPELEN